MARIGLRMMPTFPSPPLKVGCPALEQLKVAFKAAGKKLDMGKCRVHFEAPDDLPLEAIGELIAAISSEKWIEMYEQSRLMTRAGQAQLGKQGAPSASKVAAKRVDTN